MTSKQPGLHYAGGTLLSLRLYWHVFYKTSDLLTSYDYIEAVVADIKVKIINRFICLTHADRHVCT